MPSSNPDSQRYRLVARQRLYEAEILCDARVRDGRIMNGGVYLAGFAVECILKALILANSTANQRGRLRERMVREFRHDLDALRREASRRGLHMPRDVLAHFRRINTWDNNSRYEPGFHPVADALLLIGSARETIEWAERMGGKGSDE
jgi:HEPN domain-containing protein